MPSANFYTLLVSLRFTSLVDLTGSWCGCNMLKIPVSPGQIVKASVYFCIASGQVSRCCNPNTFPIFNCHQQVQPEGRHLYCSAILCFSKAGVALCFQLFCGLLVSLIRRCSVVLHRALLLHPVRVCVCRTGCGVLRSCLRWVVSEVVLPSHAKL